MRVLIADDDAIIRALLADMLVDLGHSVLEASNGAEAVAVALRERPDVAILDFLMPRMSGLDAVYAIRAGGLALPVVMVTAISDSSLRDQEGSEAVDAILEKPFKKRTVERALARAVGGVEAPRGS